ncbi:hypothetical protein Pmani_023086 [Petrolisthes manimaculis]|uniref:TauD/TfdA-like domain-containing protein n=1 Tax=Petrolisthes manimaculis TaxID=1843537 RepID=A0AAE1PBF8_9EUCA|nr:hypothetical protein Pmani_023086 [Petrolisthes manimaculis]
MFRVLSSHQLISSALHLKITTQYDPISGQGRLPRQHWGGELLKDLPVASFTELLRDEGALLHLLTTLESVGLMLVKEVPKEEGQIELLHCIKQFSGQGGDTRLADSFHVARQLRESHPSHFDALTQTLVQFTDKGVEEGVGFYTRTRRPIIT